MCSHSCTRPTVLSSRSSIRLWSRRCGMLSSCALFLTIITESSWNLETNELSQFVHKGPFLSSEWKWQLYNHSSNQEAANLPSSLYKYLDQDLPSTDQGAANCSRAHLVAVHAGAWHATLATSGSSAGHRPCFEVFVSEPPSSLQPPIQKRTFIQKVFIIKSAGPRLAE